LKKVSHVISLNIVAVSSAYKSPILKPRSSHLIIFKVWESWISGKRDGVSMDRSERWERVRATQSPGQLWDK